MADLGAEVVHVEDPGLGDPSRYMGPKKGEIPLWWKVAGRNKRSVTLNLRTSEGQDLARRLAARADVVITNFRVGTIDKWGLDWETLHALNPKLVMLQISGNGANTTDRDEPGFGKKGEAMSGVVFLTGFADGPPVHTGFSHADTVTAVMGAFAISAALTRRHDPEFNGEWIDLALFETLFRLIEWQIPVYDHLGLLPTRAGNQLAIAPGAVVNTYLTADDEWLTVTSATARSVQNIATLLGLPEEDYVTVDQQLAGREVLDDGLRVWISSRTAAECLEAMRAREVVAARIYSVRDILEDQTYRERDDILTMADADLGSIRMPGVVPKLANHAGEVWRTGPALGEDNDLVYREFLDIDDAEYAALRAAGTI